MVTFSLDDNQLRQILVLAEPLPPPLRSELLRMTAAELAGAEPGDGSLARGEGRARQGAEGRAVDAVTPPAAARATVHFLCVCRDTAKPRRPANWG